MAHSSQKHPDKDQHSEAVREFIHARDSVFARFPLVFTLLVSFGVVITFSGFNGIIEKIPVLANNPFISLIIGMVILVLTGKLYKKLG